MKFQNSLIVLQVSTNVGSASRIGGIASNSARTEAFSSIGETSTGFFLTTPGQVKTITYGHGAFGDPEVFAIGLDNQVYAERLSANGLLSSGFFLTTAGQVM